MRGSGLGLLLGVWLAALARADGVLDVFPNPVPPFNTYNTVFPNWQMVPGASFTIFECDDGGAACPTCSTSAIVGVTILNHGTATGGAAGDIADVYFQIVWGPATDSGTLTPTYAGDWDVNAVTYPAWTWVGSIVLGSKGDDICKGGQCSCNMALNLWTDISDCPTDGATVQLGPGHRDPGRNTGGGINDDCGFTNSKVKPNSPTPNIVKHIPPTPLIPLRPLIFLMPADPRRNLLPTPDLAIVPIRKDADIHSPVDSKRRRRGASEFVVRTSTPGSRIVLALLSRGTHANVADEDSSDDRIIL